MDDNDLLLHDRAAYDPMKGLRPFEVIAGGAGAPPAVASGSAAPRDSRPEIRITTDEHLVTDAALEALAAQAEDLYKRGFLLVHVVQERDGRRGPFERREGSFYRIGEVPPGRLRELLAATARWLKYDKTDEEWVPAHPPDFAVKALLARGHWPGVRPLAGVVETPVMRGDGTILDRPGYDPATALLYLPSAEFPPVPTAPTRDDALRALGELSDVVVDFPFASPAHKSTWLAALLTVCARHAFEGPAPLFVIDANVRGAGKSLLADLVALVATGRVMPRMAPTDDDAEMRKRITTIAMAADQMVLIDNIAGALGTPSLDGALTSMVWKDRILGTNDQREWPLSAVWFATGNNVVLVGDLSRRCVHIRLESPEEMPERREGFKHPELLSWVRSQRPRLVMACLTVLRAFCLAGRAVAHRLPAWGSFEGWSALVRGALVWAGEADPGETREELQSTSDSDAAALADLIRGWEEIARNNGGRCTVADAVADLQADSTGRRYEALRAALAELCPTKPGSLPSTRSIGRMLARFRGRVVGGKALAPAGGKGRAGHEWQVRAVERPGLPEVQP